MRLAPVAFVATALAATLLATPAVPASAQEGRTARDVWVDALEAAAVDVSSGRILSDVTLTRDAGVFTFESGTLHFLEAVEGRVYGAVFQGSGRFNLEAPEPVERAQIRKHHGTGSVDMPFTRAVLFFTDVTAQELATAGTAGSPGDADPEEAREEVEEALRYLTDDDRGWVSRDLLTPLLNGGPGFFYAHVAEDRDEPAMFMVDPYDAEEVRLYRRSESGERVRQTVASFHQAADYASGRSLPQEALDLVRVPAFDIETTVEGNLEIHGRATARVVPQATGHPWVPFRLHPELELDSVRAPDGSPVPTSRAEESSDIWLDLSGLPQGGGEVTFFYHGRIMRWTRDRWVVLETFRTWYPSYEPGRASTYRLTFHVPDDYTVATVGRKVEERPDEERDRVTHVFETGPVRLVAFNLGEFEVRTIEEPGVPPITVQVAEEAHEELAQLTWQYGVFIPEQEDMAGAVAQDLINSYRFFRDVFGPVPVESFLATEIPTGHGEAYPGLTLLSWSTFQMTSEKGFDEMFRAHEMAHQWWGIGVRPATSRDRWLAEGFSEFAGLWYAARARGSVDLYLERLEETRKELLDRRGEADPIALGTRVDPEDYQSVIYHKGAWVLHMLRTLLTDPDTGNDDVFAELMRSFYRNSLGKAVGTAHFEAAVTQAVGADMTWFFDQWVRGSHIPTYVFSYQLEDQPDGSVKARVRVRQEDVPEDFRMIVPILLDFGAEGTAMVRMDVNGPLTEAELPLLPMRPTRVQLNPYESVLAEVETEDWR